MKSFQSSAAIYRLLSLFFAMQFLFSCTISKTRSRPETVVEQEMTVVRILPEDDGNYVKVGFDKSQRIYRLDKNSNPDYLKLLKQSLNDHSPVLIKRAREESDVIIEVRKK